MIADELKDSIGEAIVCANLGSNYETLGNIEKALEYHQQVRTCVIYLNILACEAVLKKCQVPDKLSV